MTLQRATDAQGGESSAEAPVDAFSLVSDLAAGAASVSVGTAWRLGRRMVEAAGPLVRLVGRPAVLAPELHPATWLAGLALHGSEARSAALEELGRLLDVVVPELAESVLRRIDLTGVVEQHVELDRLVAEVDLDAAAARLDVDAIARRLDLDAVIDRIDLVGLTEMVLRVIDLPEVIRMSTGSVASDTVRGARMQGIAGDEAVSRVVDRLLLRRGGRAGQAPQLETGPPGGRAQLPLSSGPGAMSGQP